MHSWRVLILPFLGEQALYDRYDFKRPWNSPENLKLLQEMPEVYACYSHPDTTITQTAYVAVVGEETAFPGPIGRPLAEISDSPSTTLLVVETVDPIDWLEPRDLSFAEACQTRQAPCFSSHHDLPQDTFFTIYDGTRVYEGCVAYVDGDARYLQGPLTSASMATLLRINDGKGSSEPVRVDPALRIKRRYNYARIGSLSILIVLILLPIARHLWRMRKPEIESST